MPANVFIVLSDPPEDISAEAFNAFYDLHARQILELPAFVAAERFALQFVRGTSDAPPQFSHYVRYEIEGEFDEAWRQLRAAIDSGRMDMPDWFSRVHTEGWHGSSLGGLVQTRA